MSFMQKVRNALLWVIAIYAVFFLVSFFCVRSSWGKGLVEEYISSNTGCTVQIDRSTLNLDLTITVFNLNVYTDETKALKLFTTPSLTYGWGSVEARRIKIWADYDCTDRPFSSNLHKFGSEQDFYDVEKLNDFFLSMLEDLDDVSLHDISIELKMNGKVENHFLTKFIKEPLHLPDENNVYYFVLGDNLRWLTTKNGKILSTVRVKGEDKGARVAKSEDISVSAVAPEVEEQIVEESLAPVIETPVVPKVVPVWAAETIAEESAAEPVAETPAVETPVVETPAAETPAAEPVAETPAADTPAVETPAVETPAAETPAAEPVAETPAKADE